MLQYAAVSELLKGECFGFEDKRNGRDERGKYPLLQ